MISEDQTEQMRASADAMAQAVKADKAAIESAKAAIGASQATAENAKVQLSYTDIFSPIDGRTGNLTVKQGNVVTANSMDLMTINQVEPIYVTFSVPKRSCRPSSSTWRRASCRCARGRRTTPRRTKKPAMLTFIDNAVDVTTGTIKLKGTFPIPTTSSGRASSCA